MGTLFWSYDRQVLEFINHLLMQPQSQLYLALASSVFDAQVHGCPRRHLRELLIECGVGRFSIDGNHAISRSDPCPVGVAVGINLNNFRLASEVGCGGEPRRSHRHGLGDHVQARKLEEVVVRNLLHPRYVVAKELGKTLPGDRLSRQFDTVGIGKEAVLLGVMLVHPLQHVTQRFFPICHLANAQIQQDAENLALVVVTDAPLWRAIVRSSLRTKRQGWTLPPIANGARVAVAIL